MGRLQDKDYEIHGEEGTMAPNSGSLGSVVDPAYIWCTAADATSGE